MESANEVTHSQGVKEESFDSFPEPTNHLQTGEAPLNELRLLMHIEREDSHPLPVGTYTERCVYQKLEQLTGVTPERVRRINIFDTIVEVNADDSVVALVQALQQVRNWEDNPVRIGCILGSSTYITDVCRQRNIIIEQQAELHHQQEQHTQALKSKEKEIKQLADHHREELVRQAEEMKSTTLSQKTTIAELTRRMDQQVQLVNDLQVQAMESNPRISNSLGSHDGVYDLYPRKMNRNPDLPHFSGEKPTPKGEVEYDNWIFQVKNLRKTYTDDAVKNGVVSCVRGVANIIVRAAGYESTLDHMIQCLDDKFGHSETDDSLLQEFHKMQQGSNERVMEYGSKLECKFRFLQERFPNRYNDDQLRDRFFSSVKDKTRDAIRHKYDYPVCTFNELLTAAMKAEAETTHTVGKAKAAIAAIDSDTNPELLSIEDQLLDLNGILKSANLAGNGKRGDNKTNNDKSTKKGKAHIQCHRCMGWGHFLRDCASTTPVEGSVEWEQLQRKQ